MVLLHTAPPRQRSTRKGDANPPISACVLEEAPHNFVAAPVEPPKGHDRSNLLERAAQRRQQVISFRSAYRFFCSLA